MRALSHVRVSPSVTLTRAASRDQFEPVARARAISSMCSSRPGTIGLLCGPLVGGVVADAIGLTATLLAGAAVVLAAAVFAPRRDIIGTAAE